jgi:hypothetical protein
MMSRMIARTTLTVAASLTFLLAAADDGRAAAGYVHEIKGKVRYKMGGRGRWTTLPPNLLVNTGDKLRLRAGVRARLVYLGRGGGSRTLKGPRTITVRAKGSATARRAPKGKPNLKQVIGLLVTRKRSYHRKGVGSLSSSSGNYVNLINPRFTVIAKGGPVTLRWLPRRGQQHYTVSVWRYKADASEQRLSIKMRCPTKICHYKLPPSFKLVTGKRYNWSVKPTQGGYTPYPRDGVWFSLASPDTQRSLAADLKRARSAPATYRKLYEVVAYVRHGFHAKGLAALGTPTNTVTKRLKAQLLCVTCRTKAANRLAKSKTFCKCKEEPDG